MQKFLFDFFFYSFHSSASRYSKYRCMQELGLFSFFSFLFFCLDVQTGSPEPSVMDKSHDSCAAAFLFTRIQLFNVRGSIASKSFVQLLTGQFNWINLS